MYWYSIPLLHAVHSGPQSLLLAFSLLPTNVLTVTYRGHLLDDFKVNQLDSEDGSSQHLLGSSVDPGSYSTGGQAVEETVDALRTLRLLNCSHLWCVQVHMHMLVGGCVSCM